MKLKSTVRLPEINKHGVYFFRACLAAEEITGQEITITSGNDGTHMGPSFHYKNQAWDIRVNDKTKEQREELYHFFKAWLGKGWDVILEEFDDQPERDHIHIERDTANYPEA